MKKIFENSKIIYVNDGSKDKTWELIQKIYKEEKLFTGICLSRNRGHQNALLAGLMSAKKYANVVISMDADLQDDINAMDEMLDKYYTGNEIVYGVRSARKKDTWFKRVTAECFYKFMEKMGVEIVYNHADYRLTSKNVLNYLENYREANLFLRGIFPLIGFKLDIVYYERNERFVGKSKYPLKKMLSFGIIGQYIGKIYNETKQRPRYIISCNLNEKKLINTNKNDLFIFVLMLKRSITNMRKVSNHE